MSLALKLARKGRYGVGSNPMVGCVIVRESTPWLTERHGYDPTS